MWIGLSRQLLCYFSLKIHFLGSRKWRFKPIKPLGDETSLNGVRNLWLEKMGMTASRTTKYEYCRRVYKL